MKTMEPRTTVVVQRIPIKFATWTYTAFL